MRSLSLDATNARIGSCFQEAEQIVRDRVEALGYCNETEITFLLREHLTLSVQHTSETGGFEKALLKDLSETCRSVRSKSGESARKAFVRGLIGQVVWHTPQAEGRRSRRPAPTGGDFGIVLARPRIPWQPYGSSPTPNRVTQEQQGLLVQAKLRRTGRSFGGFSKPQQEVYPSRKDYFAILRYDYVEGARLAPFLWSSCRGKELREVEKWLASGDFPDVESRSSDDVVHGVARGELGTGNRQAIRDFIAATKCPTLEIRIDWPDGKRPRPPSVRQLIHPSARTHQEVRVHKMRDR